MSPARLIGTPSLALLLSVVPTPTVEAPLGPIVAAFTSQQIWDGDNGGTIDRLGLPQQAVHLLTSASPRLARLPLPEDGGPGVAAVSPSGDLVAFDFHYWGQAPKRGPADAPWAVFVTDLSGRIVKSFPFARQFSWSPDGRRVAVIEGTPDSTGWEGTARQLLVWDRRTGATRAYPARPEAVHWKSRDSLLLQVGEEVLTMDLPRGRITPTAHRATAVSPDGRFSIRQHAHGDFAIFDDPTGIRIGACLLDRLDTPDAEGPAPQPFWVDGGSSLACVSSRCLHGGAPGQGGCRVGVFDCRRLSPIAVLAGSVVAPTRDRRGVVVLRGDTLDVLDLSRLKSARPRNPIRIRVATDSWSSGPAGGTKHEGTWEHDVAEGEWFPTRVESHTGCDGLFRVGRVFGPDSVEVVIPRGPYGGPAGRTAVITGTPRRFATASLDGGYQASLSVLPWAPPRWGPLSSRRRPRRSCPWRGHGGRCYPARPPQTRRALPCRT